MEEKIRVSVVAYLNAQPFIYGLKHHEVIKKIDLNLDIPSECARKLLNNEAAIGLVPVAVIPQLKDFEIRETCIIMTEKDAIKCHQIKSKPIFVLPVKAILEEKFWQQLLNAVSKSK